MPLKSAFSVIPAARFLALLLAGLFVLGCNEAPASGRGSSAKLRTGFVEVTDEAKAILPKGTVIYYTKSYQEPFTKKHHWTIEKLDVHSGKTHELISDQTSGIDELIPVSISPDKRFLLISGSENRRTALFELKLDNLALRKIADDFLAGDYSPDGKYMVVYYIPDIQTFKKTFTLRVAIVNRTGEFIKKLPCQDKRCIHPTWVKDSIFYAQEHYTTPKNNQHYSRIIKYNTQSGTEKIEYISPKGNIEINYPILCGNKLVFLLSNKHKTYIKELNMTSEKTWLAIKDKNGQVETIKLNSAIAAQCPPNNNDYLIISKISPRKFLKPVERIHFELYDLKLKQFNRIMKTPSTDTGFLSPIISAP